MTSQRPAAAGQAEPLRLLLVTGMSGAGKTSALKALEDLGYDSVDHLPLPLLGRLLSHADNGGSDMRKPLAVGIDIRTRGFEIDTVLQEVDRLRSEGDVHVSVLFLDCDDDDLRRRYTETRHRHPLAADRPLSDGIAHERDLLAPLRRRSDVVIDSSRLSLGALKRLLGEHFALHAAPTLSVFVTSFSFRLGLPREADIVFDVRFLANPHYDPVIRHLTGRDPEVAAFIRRDEGLRPFLDALAGLMRPLLPRYAAEGKSYLTIAIGCTGGRHRSVFVAEWLTEWLAEQGLTVHNHHRDLNRSES